MRNNIKASKKPQTTFWIVSISCLVFAVFMICRAAYLYYHLYFGKGFEVLSEKMGTDQYQVFLSETFGAEPLFLFGTFIALTFSMVSLILRKYQASKYSLIGFTLFATVNHFYSTTTLLDLTIPFILFGALFWHVHKHEIKMAT